MRFLRKDMIGVFIAKKKDVRFWSKADIANTISLAGVAFKATKK